ncbi:hydroxyacylglutathione hydrolase [Maricaulis sp. CAU 1757]
MSELQIRQFACLDDNYGFLVHDPQSGETASIDTPDPDEILRQADQAGWRITQIWNTHHHHDHAGGNLALKTRTGARIIGPELDRERLPGLDDGVGDGDVVRLGEHAARVLFTPGHTRGHVCYHFADDKVAFVGDTLFALGCGRLFEGTPAQMWDSLQRLAALPDDTRLYCAHEYTEANARFARTIDPDNPALESYAASVIDKRSRGLPTVPTTVAVETTANPFLRATCPAIAERLDMPNADPVDVFAEIRKRKDQF